MGKMIMNGIPYGGGEVAPNPTGTPTDTLNTLGINNTIYNIAGSGGSSSGVYIEEVIYDTYTASNGTYTLNNSIDNYDALLICGYGYAADDPTSMLVSQFVTKAEFDKYFALIATVTGQTRRVTINFPDSNHVTVSSIEGSIALKYIYGLKMSGNFFTPQIYSTEEREVGVWINGKPLYQVTLTQNEVAALADTGKTRHINLGLSNIENIWVMDASIGGNNTINIPYIHYDTRNLVGYFWDMNNGSPILEIRTGDDSSGFAINCITLQYTKSTDTPGSGKYNTLGVPTVHYDDTEKIIGTWFGETLYEKSYVITSIPSPGTTIDNVGNIGVSPYIKGSFLRLGRWYNLDGRTESANYNQYYCYAQIMNNGDVVLNYEGYSTSEIIKICITIQYTKTT